MNFLDLEYFITAAEEMNFTRAARKHFISQQSLSNHIKRIEAYFDVKLFQRGPIMTLTPAGERLLVTARKIMLNWKDINKEIQDIKNIQENELTIGVSIHRSQIYIPLILPIFKTKYPHINIHLVEKHNIEVETALCQGKIDLFIGPPPENRSGGEKSIVSKVGWKENMVAIIPKAILSTLSIEEQKRICSSEATERILMGKCPFLKMLSNTWLGKLFEDYCRENNLNVDIVFESGNIDTMINLCLEGMGVFICPDIFLIPKRDTFALRKEQIVIIPIENSGYTKRDLAVNYLKDRYLSNAMRSFIECFCIIGEELEKDLQEIPIRK